MRLEHEYLQAASWQIATLEQLCERKRTSKSDVERQRNIVIKMVRVCQEIDPVWLTWNGTNCPWSRVNDMLGLAKKEPAGLLGAVDRFIARVSSV
jgi:hypothetical protein